MAMGHFQVKSIQASLNLGTDLILTLVNNVENGYMVWEY